MILTSRAPVRWPDQDRIDAAWAKEMAEVDGSVLIGADGLLHSDGEVVPVRLEGGVHLAPGAAYRLVEPRLSAAEVTFGIEGHEGARALVAEYRPTRGWLPVALGGRTKAPASVRFDGLDLLRGVHSTSTLPYLAWDVAVVPAVTEPVTARVRLRWLSVHVVARVHPAAEGTGDLGELECEVRLSGRGPWSPVVGAALAVGGRFVRSGFDDFVADCARQATEVAEGREPTRPGVRQPEAKLQRCRQANQITRLRLHRALDEVERLPRWRRTQGAWAREYDALPPVTWWPEPVEPSDWVVSDQLAAAQVGRAPRPQRRTRIDEVLDADLASKTRWVQSRAQAHQPVEEPSLPIHDGQVDLRWLRSPLTMWRYARALENPPPATRPDSDAPGATTG